MSFDGITAYDVPARVTRYDRDMAIMHPNRSKMVDVALDFVPLPRGFDGMVLDLGTGTGIFARETLLRFPDARVVGIDGAASMVDVAKSRLGDLADRLEIRVGDFRALADLLGADERFDLVISSYALHHLNPAEKEAVVAEAAGHMNPGAWLINADIIVGATPELEARYQALRVEGCVARAEGDPRFADAATTRGFLDDLEANEGDQPLPVFEDVAIFARAGLKQATVLWLEYREAVTVGRK